MSNHIEINLRLQTYVDPFPGKDAAEVIFVNCDRCGGAGHLAGFETVYGGVCFGCNGARGANSTIGEQRKKAKGKVTYANSKERKLIKKQEFHNAQMEAAEAAFPILAGWHDAMDTNAFLQDLWLKAFDYELSEKQVAAAAKSMQSKVDREAQRQAEHDALSPAPAGKERISGTVVSVKVQEGNYGSVWKMVVLDARNFKVWTTIPAALWDQMREQSPEGYNPAAEDFKGRQVAFNATLEVSDTDNTFAFAKRPTKALLQAETAEQAPEATPAAEEPAEAPAAPAEAPAAEAPAAPSTDIMFALAGREVPGSAPQAGETVTHKDGTAYTFLSVSKDGLCYRVKDAAGKASYKRISAFV